MQCAAMLESISGETYPGELVFTAHTEPGLEGCRQRPCTCSENMTWLCCTVR